MNQNNSGSARFTSAGLTPYAGPFTRADASHFARRTMIGATKSDISTLAQKTVSDAVDFLLTAAPTPPEPVAYVNSGAVTQGNPWADSKFEAGAETGRNVMLKSWWISLMLNQTTSITEKMTLFWHNHFATSNNTVKDARYMYKQHSMLRENALGNFKTMVREITFDPAILRFLSGATNTKSHPNENYGRELQELFSIGKGPEIAPGNYTNYTEADVKTAARILTGWSDVIDSMTTKFTTSNHDSGTKQFSAAYGNTVIQGSTSEAGARREIDEMLTMIFNQPATAQYLVRKLYRWFVDYEIDAQTDANVIQPLATILRNSGYEVRPVLSALFKSEHFFDSVKRGCVIKNPIDFLIGTFRNFRAPDFFETDLRQQYWGNRTLTRWMFSLQMDIMNPPNVAGWPAYWQTPDYHELWINSDTLQKRVRFTNELSTDGLQVDEQYEKGYFDVIEAAKRTNDPTSLDALVREWSEWMYPLPIPDESIVQFKQVVLNGLPDYEWTVEWNDFTKDETNTTKRDVVVAKLRVLLKYMLAMAEYQLS